MFAVSRREAALTARFLDPATSVLEALFLTLRAETDQVLGRGAPARYGKPYPYGYCLEITRDVFARLKARLERPRHPGERAIKVFLSQGGSGRQVWGVLRDRYFQNALRLGGLYVDVSNDTVDTSKPKVEILPMDLSGLEAIRDAAHYARIGEAYWGATFYANHAVPSLASLFPIAGVDARGRARLYSKGDLMIDLFCDSDFTLAERWLEDAPAPPSDVVDALRAHCSPSLLRDNPHVGRRAALDACRRDRIDRRATNLDWRAAQSARLFGLLRSAMPALARG